eukprot:4415933-Prymnesium_polylepis.3
MHLFDISPSRIAEVEIPTGLPLLYDPEANCLRLFEGQPSDYNFGKGGEELLFSSFSASSFSFAALRAARPMSGLFRTDWAPNWDCWRVADRRRNFACLIGRFQLLERQK